MTLVHGLMHGDEGDQHWGPACGFNLMFYNFSIFVMILFCYNRDSVSVIAVIRKSVPCVFSHIFLSNRSYLYYKFPLYIYIF